MCQVQLNYITFQAAASINTPESCLDTYAGDIYLVKIQNSASPDQFLTYNSILGCFTVTTVSDNANLFTGNLQGINNNLYFRDTDNKWYQVFTDPATFLLTKNTPTGAVGVFYDGDKIKATINSTNHYMSVSGGIPFMTTAAADAATFIPQTSGNNFIAYNPDAVNKCQFILSGGIANQDIVVNSPGKFSGNIAQLCGISGTAATKIDVFSATEYSTKCFDKLKGGNGDNTYKTPLSKACNSTNADGTLCLWGTTMCSNIQNFNNKKNTALPAAVVPGGGDELDFTTAIILSVSIFAFIVLTMVSLKFLRSRLSLE